MKKKILNLKAKRKKKINAQFLHENKLFLKLFRKVHFLCFIKKYSIINHNIIICKQQTKKHTYISVIIIIITKTTTN